MTQYINKDALVAEIERTQKRLNIDDIGGRSVMAWSEGFKNFIDTLEVKEVDIDTETTHYLLYEHCSPLNEIMHKADLKLEIQYHKDIENAFKAGFELGMQVNNKAQKGE